MRLASGKVDLEKFWTPGRASEIMALRLSAACWIEAIDLRRSSAAGLPCSLISWLVLSARTPNFWAAIPALRAAIRASPIASARSGARSASTFVVRSRFSRMSAIEFWFLSLSNSVSRSVRRWMRSINSGALLSSAPSPPVADGSTGQPCGPMRLIGGAPLTAPSSWISLTPVKPTPLIWAVVP